MWEGPEAVTRHPLMTSSVFKDAADLTRHLVPELSSEPLNSELMCWSNCGLWPLHGSCG